jgi:hypothetical protein
VNLYCRFSKETTTVPYGIAGLPEAVAFVEKRGVRPARAISRIVVPGRVDIDGVRPEPV